MQTTKSSAIVERALDFMAQRQKMISSNLANVDTPFYKARDISFESMLSKEAQKLYNNENSSPMAKTHTKHLDPADFTGSGSAAYYFRGNHTTRNDGNNVDLDIESTEMSKNSMQYNALIAAKKKNTAIFKAVIEASGKVS